MEDLKASEDAADNNPVLLKKIKADEREFNAAVYDFQHNAER
jgi:hypothetical protein